MFLWLLISDVPRPHRKAEGNQQCKCSTASQSGAPIVWTWASTPSAVYDVQTVAVACLASAGTLKPGPDSDCAACGPACTQESRQEVCDLYCNLPAINKTTIAVIIIKLALMPGLGIMLKNLKNTFKIEALHTKTTESMQAICLLLILVLILVLLLLVIMVGFIGVSILIFVVSTLLIMLWIKKNRKWIIEKGMRMWGCSITVYCSSGQNVLVLKGLNKAKGPKCKINVYNYINSIVEIYL